ncbi:PREDICTED: LOW QUALITY PROTEIN: lysine histidine transporter-like 6 [Tarenaya hassleriana]|uniref:LOW QUALITY PROTEIN: lysine histidine transporter-like 6 n=1 Tax=Tarenaya hassleriana TaxID=28532 RepID=UPI0008FCFA3D|nr:PREDICTED: LOW QUALITY PROTEIN: lysine histidine transporter-like 6 [Tarenaya hassleriana]
MVSTSSTPPPPKEKEEKGGEKWREGEGKRRAKWWYSTFPPAPAMIGAGVLSLPSAISFLGWGPGTMVLVMAWGMTLNTMWQMVQLHECVPGTRFDRYIDLGRFAFGPKLGPWIVLPQQLIVQVGCNIVYMVTGGKCLKKFVDITCSGSCADIRQSYWILIFGGVHFFLSQLPNFNSVAGVSLAAAVMSLSYSTIAWVGSLTRGRIPDVSYAYRRTNPTDSIFRIFNALGQISFAFAGHAVALEIQATMPSSPEKPSRVPMWHGVIGAYFVNAICYFPVALICYWVFGQDVDDNVLLNLQRPDWLIASANLMVVVHVIGSYQVFAMPVFDLLEGVMVKRFNFSPGLVLRLFPRSIYVAFTLFVAVTFPFFGDLLGFFGGFGFAPTSFFLPSIMWLIIKKPKRLSITWLINWVSIFIGLFIMVASTVGGLRNIIADSSTYSFYT